MLFLNPRSGTPPDAFAMYVYNSFHLGITSQAIVPPFLNEYTMMFTGRSISETYGELRSWDDHEDAFDAMHTGRAMHPGHGLVILRAQERVLKFLVVSCEQMLQDIPPDTLTSGDFPVPVESANIQESKSDQDKGFENLAIMAAEAPYRRPISLDLARVTSLLSARVSAAQDYIWVLREDPGYFAQCVGEIWEHR